MREVKDGTLWFGDEFGPFLQHTDATGKVLGPPIPLSGVQAPENPFLVGAPNLPSSGGFEGVAMAKWRSSPSRSRRCCTSRTRAALPVSCTTDDAHGDAAETAQSQAACG